MRPEKLEFSGIKSYTDKVIIDFNQLTNGGLFGIFGNTGSGKSTILDCIFLALYGKLPQTNSREDYINYKCTKGYIRFTFSLFNMGSRSVYQVYREFELKGSRKNQPQGVAKLYIVTDEGLSPLDEGVNQVNNKIFELIGLKIEDFQRCIVLPQGEFAAFVKLTKAERLRMISSLFNLDKYGDKLTSKVKKRLSDLDRELEYQKGLLDGYQDVTEEILKLKNQELENNKSELIIQNEIMLKIVDKFNDYKKDYEHHNELIQVNSKLGELTKIKSNIDNYKFILDNIEFAKQICKASEDLEDCEQDKIKLNGILSEQKQRLDDAKSRLEEVSDKLLKSQSQLLVKEKNLAQIGALNGLTDTQDTIERDNKKLLELRKNYKDLSETIHSAENRIKQKNAEYTAYVNRPEFVDIEQKINLQINQIVKSAQSSFVNEEVQFLKSLDVTEEVLQKINLRIELLLSKVEDIDLQQSISTLAKLNENFAKLKDFESQYNAEIAKINSTIESDREKLEQTLARGKELSDSINLAQEKINKLTGGKTLSQAIELLNQEVNKTDAYIKALNDEKERYNISIASTTEKINSTKEKLQSIEDNILTLQQNLDKDLIVLSLEKATEIYSYYDKKDQLASKISEYQRDYYGLNSRKGDLEKLLLGKSVSKEEFEKLSNLEAEEKNKYNILDKNINYLEKEYINLSQKFKKRCTIVKDITDLTTQKNLVDDLHSIIKNNKFLEFIAEEYLSEIALQAKNTLLQLTGGRYGLIYDGQFFIEDFIYNNGERRTIETVSGGELFLVSLSLALALSQSIYEKSLSRMEFFFLDEGFGSLDKDLVEVVVDCLFKLKNSNFSIGVISHVEALKERLPIRLNVIGATENSGSKVSMIA